MTQQAHSHTRSVLEIVSMVAGLLIWAAHLGVIYGVHAVACARGWGLSAVPWIIGFVTIAAVLGSLLVLSYSLRDLRRIGGTDTEQPDRFLAYTTATIAAFSILAIVWAATPAFFIAPCF